MEELQVLFKSSDFERIISAKKEWVKVVGDDYGKCKFPNSSDYYEKLNYSKLSGEINLRYTTWSKENYTKIADYIRSKFKYIGELKTQGADGNFKFYTDGKCYYGVWDEYNPSYPNAVFSNRTHDIDFRSVAPDFDE